MNCEELDAFLRVSFHLCFSEIISGALSVKIPCVKRV